MTTRINDVVWLLVLGLGAGCSAAHESNTASQTNEIVAGEDHVASSPQAATDVEEAEAPSASSGQPGEPPAHTAPAPAASEGCPTPNAECPPPPIEWCDSNRDDVPLPEWLADHWNSFCDEAETDAGAASPPPPPDADAIACGIAIGGANGSPCPPPPPDWCDADRDGFPLQPELAAYWNTACGDAAP